MISRLIQSASIDMKMDMETLLNGGEITVCFDRADMYSASLKMMRMQSGV